MAESLKPLKKTSNFKKYYSEVDLVTKNTVNP